MSRLIYAADIGSTRCDRGREPRFAWVRVDPDRPSELTGSSDISRLADAVIADLQKGSSVALGIEAPVFLPVPMAADNLCRGRVGEGNRSFAAPAGLAVTTLGVHQSAWLFRRIREQSTGNIRFTLDCRDWPPRAGEPILFCWEAFVSGPAHTGSGSHIHDAATAVMEFIANEHRLVDINSVSAESPLSLIGAAALWSGLSNDISLLHMPSLVIKPSQAFEGSIGVFPGFIS